jgi:hypothetical protein
LKSWPIVNEPTQITAELKRWFASTPGMSGLLTTSSLALTTVWCARFYQAEPAPVVGTAKYPVPLCLTSVLPPSERRDPSPARTLLLGLRSYGHMCQSRWLSSASVLPLVRGVFAGCYQPLLPAGSSRRYAENLSSDAWAPTPAVPLSALAWFFLSVFGLPQR